MHNRNHTSTFGFVYAQDTAPTPWPYLAAGLGLSVVLTIFSIGSQIVFEKKQKRRKRKGLPPEPQKTWGKGQAILSSCSIGIGLIRSVALLISTAKAEAKTGGPYSSPSVLVVLFLSIYIQIRDRGIPHPGIYLVIWLELVCVCVSLIIDSYRGYLIKTPKRAYGKLVPSGGSCPQVVHECSWPNKQGCNPALNLLHNSTATPPTYDDLDIDASYIVLMDLIWTIFIHLIAIGFLVITLGSLAGLWEMKRWLKPWRLGQHVDQAGVDTNRTSAAEQGHGGPLDQANDLTADKSTPLTNVHHVSTAESSSKKKETVCETFSNTICVMLIFAAATFTVHYFQETRPKTYYFIDGSGTIGVPGSWSDCFRSKPPVDRYGFWGAWSAAQKGKWENLLAVV